MTVARYIVGDVRRVLSGLGDGSVQSVITSPPYFRKRSYMPADHADVALEVGQEETPAEFLTTLLSITDELWRVLADDGTIWFVIGDTASGSGGSGGDYLPGGFREGQARWSGTTRAAGEFRARRPFKGEQPGFPLAKSVCWIPELFGASLAYGRNLLTGEPCRQWITRPPVTWCKPNPMVGEIIDKFREATELIVWAAKQPRYYFDLDALRHPGGAPPLNWWEVPTYAYSGAHFATFPSELIVRPLIASCPPGGTVLDPFAGSGTTLAVATGHGRDAIGIDLDERNLDLARARVGMFLVDDSIDAGRDTVDVETGGSL